MRLSPVRIQQNSNAGSVFDSTFGTVDNPAKEVPFEASKKNRKDDFPAFGSERDTFPSNSSSASDIQADSAKPSPSSTTTTKDLNPSTNQPVPDAQENAASSPTGSKQLNSDSSSVRSNGLVGVDGKPVASSVTQATTKAVPLQSPVSAEKPFDFSEINPMYWWLLVPLLLVPLFLFRFVMGTSSSYELAKYKYRGPSVQDPDDPSVRGRFKKRTSSHDSSSVIDEAVGEEPAKDSADPEDDLSFLDEVEDEISFDVASTLAPTSHLDDSASELSADMTSESDAANDLSANDFEPQSVDSHEELISVNEQPTGSSSESEPVNDHSDSDVDFDFFMEDEDVQSNDDLVTDEVARTAEPIGEIDKQFEDAAVDYQTSGSEAVADAAEFSLGQELDDNASDDSDDGLDFSDDDSDNAFGIEDEEVPDLAVSNAGTDDLTPDYADEVAADAEIEFADDESEDRTLETAVAATAAVAATVKGGSWMKRLFGGRKGKKTAVEQDAVPEDNAIAATAVRETEDQEDDLQLEDVNPIEEQPVQEVGAEDTTVPDGVKISQSGEHDFSDSSEAFSLDDDDDSMDGMFDDDSDAGYQFDAEEAEAPVVAQSDESDSADDIEPMLSEQDDHHDEIVPAANATLPELESSQSDEDQLEPSDLTESRFDLASAKADGEFNPIGHPSGSEELPLLEDQLLDEIVDSETGSSSDDQVLPMETVGVAAGGVAAGLTENLGSETVNEDAGAIGFASEPTANDSSTELLAELRSRIEELESQNAAVEADRSSLKSEVEELRLVSVDEQKLEDDKNRLAELEQQLNEERLAKQELEAKLTAEAEAKRQAAAEVEQARAEVEATQASAREAAAKAEEAIAKATADKTAAEKSSAGMSTGSLLAAAGGVVAGAAVADGSSESVSSDDPFRLAPDQVKVMLKKLKTERKKRLKTKEYFLEADAKRREVANTLQQVSGELENLKLEFQKVTDASTDNVPREAVAELKEKLDAAEDALKKNRPSS